LIVERNVLLVGGQQATLEFQLRSESETENVEYDASQFLTCTKTAMLHTW